MQGANRSQPSTRLQARYGQESVPAEIALNPLIEHLLDHRSVRAYLPDPVTDAELAAIAGVAASTAHLRTRLTEAD